MKTKFILIGIIILALVGVGLLLEFPGAVAQEREDGKGGTEELPSAKERQQDECKTLARQICARFDQPPGSDSICSFRCRITADLVDTSLTAQSVSDLQIVLNRDRLHLTSEALEVYRDTGAVVTVLPYMRAVYIYTAPVSPDASTDPTQWLWMQDQLFVKSLVTECEDRIDGNGTRYKFMAFSPDPDLQRGLNIKSFSMLLDVDNKTVSEVSLVPFRPTEYSRMTWSLSDIQYGRIPDDMRSSVVTQVVDGNRRLKGKYAEYKLDDNRYLSSADTKR